MENRNEWRNGPGRPKITKEEKKFNFETGQKMRGYMEEVGINQAKMADIIGMSATQVGKMLNGETGMALHTYEKMLKACGKEAIVLPRENEGSERTNCTSVEYEIRKDVQKKQDLIDQRTKIDNQIKEIDDKNVERIIRRINLAK